MRRRKQGTSIAEYLLPTSLVLGATIAFLATGSFSDTMRDFFTGTLDGVGTSKVVLQPLGSQVMVDDALKNFDSKTYKGLLQNMSPTCMADLGVCILAPNSASETSGGLGNRAYLAQKVALAMARLDQSIGKNPGLSSLKMKFRNLSNAAFDLSLAQQQLATAMRKFDYDRIRELVQEINGGSVTYVQQTSSGSKYVLVAGNQQGTLVGQLRDIRTDIVNDPKMGALQGASSTIDGYFNVIENVAAGNSTLVVGLPPAQSNVLVETVVNNDDNSSSSAPSSSSPSESGSGSSGGSSGDSTSAGGVGSSSGFNLAALVKSTQAQSETTSNGATQSCTVGKGNVEQGSGGNASKCVVVEVASKSDD